MSMPIQRQSEQFAAFDTSPRWARDRESYDLPKGLAGLINTTGPRITGGLLNTREAGMHYPDEYDPRVDGFPEEDPRRIVPTRAEAEADEYEGDDYDDYDYSLENHDPHRYIPENFVDPREARRGSGRHPFDRAAAVRQAKGKCECWEGYERVPGTEPCAEGSCRKCDSHRKNSSKIAAEMSYDDIMKRIDEQLAQGEPQSEIPRDGDPLHPSLLGRNQCQNCGHFATDHGEVNHVSIGDDYKGMFCWPCMDELKSTWYDKDGHYRTADLMPQQMPLGGGYQIGHQVGLEWRPGSNINGTVIGLDPVSNSVKVRWADGQYSTEEPRNIHLL